VAGDDAVDLGDGHVDAVFHPSAFRDHRALHRPRRVDPELPLGARLGVRRRSNREGERPDTEHREPLPSAHRLTSSCVTWDQDWPFIWVGYDAHLASHLNSLAHLQHVWARYPGIEWPVRYYGPPGVSRQRGGRRRARAGAREERRTGRAAPPA